MKYPDIYKNKIVFTYEGDLWLANTDGTDAKRITSFPGDEISARVFARWEIDCIYRRI